MYKSISDKDYHALNILSQSTLKTMIDAGFEQMLAEQRKPFKSDSARIGRVAHAMNLLGETKIPTFERADGRTKEGKEAKKQMEGLYLYRFTDEIEMFNAMRKNYLDSKDAQDIMQSATNIEDYGIVKIHNERFPDKPVEMKFKPDIVGPDFIADYKTTGDYCSDKNIAKTMKNFHYPFQAAAYLICDTLLTGKSKQNYYWIFQETIEPYGVKVVQICPDTMQIAFDKFDHAINKYMRSINYPEKRSPNYEQSTISLLYY